jgi:hypothetical protein
MLESGDLLPAMGFVSISLEGSRNTCLHDRTWMCMMTRHFCHEFSLSWIEARFNCVYALVFAECFASKGLDV